MSPNDFTYDKFWIGSGERMLHYKSEERQMWWCNELFLSVQKQGTHFFFTIKGYYGVKVVFTEET
jgi:hypothetical protein